MGDVKELKVGDRLSIKEKKTGKINVIIINKEIKQALSAYLKTEDLNDRWFLFKSRKGSNAPLTTFRVTRLVKLWADAIGLKGNYGAHTLRKTFSYIQRVHFGVSWEVLSQRLNHSSPSVTRRYLGVQKEEVESILLNNI